MRRFLALAALSVLLAGPLGLGGVRHHVAHAPADPAGHADCHGATEAPGGAGEPAGPVDSGQDGGGSCAICSALAHAPLALAPATHVLTAPEARVAADAPVVRCAPSGAVPVPQGRAPPVSA